MYVVFSVSGKEQRARDWLEAHDIEAVLVQETIRKRVSRYSRREIEIERPIIPRVIFADFRNDIEAARMVYQGRDISTIMSNFNGYVQVTRREVDAFALSCGHYEAEAKKKSLTFSVGQLVSVRFGIFEGMTGVIEKIADDKASVSLNEMNFPVSLGIAMLVNV